VPVPVEHSW